MPDLPIRRMILYKHGVGYFERRGAVEGETLQLSFPRAAMDDVLKSLVALDLGSGQVLGVAFETPEDRQALIARGSIHLSDNRSLLDLLRDLRGRRVRLWFVAGQDRPEVDDPGVPLDGLVIGVDVDDDAPLKMPLLSLYQADERRVRAVAVRDIARLELLDERAADDLGYFLRAAQSDEDHRVATLRLSPGQHDLLVGYVAPAPSWRVSYRLLVEPQEDAQLAEQGVVPVLLQGWGLFDNQLDEDLADVELVFVAGMPVSFRYRLYEPHTPERPLIVDENRTVAAPVEFDQLLGAAGGPVAAAPAMAEDAATMHAMSAPSGRARRRASIEQAEASIKPAAAGEERGALFQYRVAHPVSVARGQSAMAPIVGQRLSGHKQLLYNGNKLARHPVASLRIRNLTGLTLERGPVTVLEAGDYAGEAVLPFTRPNGEVIVPYAVELGIDVREEPGATRHIRGVQVQNEFLLIQEWDVRSVRYSISNTLQAQAELTIEQQLLQGYELVDTLTPSEQAHGVARWRVACPPGTETQFVVQQRRLVSLHERVSGLTGQQLSDLLKQRLLDEATYRELGEVLRIYQRIDAHNRRFKQIEQERQQVYQRQNQAQASLAPLGHDRQEGALRLRYVTLLNELEDQLAALAAEEQRLQAEIEQLAREAEQRLAGLSTAAST